MGRKKIDRSPTCHCGSPTTLRSGDYVYGKDRFTDIQVYVCDRYPECDSYVGVHDDSRRPKGTLADKKLRTLRIHAHRELDELWKTGIMGRSEAYRFLTENTGIRHIGETTHEEAQKVIEDFLSDWKAVQSLPVR